MNIQVREAVVSDYLAIAEISRNELGYDCSDELVEEKLKNVLESNREKIFVAVSSNQVIGYIHGENYDVLYFQHMKNVMGIAVLKEYQNKGVGTSLLNAVEDWAVSANAYAIRINSGASRKESHEFYRSKGYGLEKEQIKFMKICK